MDKINFVELATYCANRYRESHNTTNDSYAGTLYVAIMEDNKVLCSKTPHILRNAKRCILVHQRDQLAVTNYYLWYFVEYIDDNGCVSNGNLGDGFSMGVSPWGGFANQIMSLDYNNSHLFWCKSPFENHMAKIWGLYIRLKEIKSPKEIELAAELFLKDEKILELENKIEDFTFANQLLKQERDQYKELLDEIKASFSKE